MRRRIAIIARLAAWGFAVLALWLGYHSVIAASRLDAHARNPRLIARGFTVKRGDIFSADGARLARSVRRGKLWEREYPAADKTAHIVGYYSLRYGVTGVERAYNSELVGRRGFATFGDWVEETMGRRRTGNDLVLTLDMRVQDAALDALGDARGACVAIDPRTGDVLALATSPRFDPTRVDERFEELSADPAAPLIDRAIQGLYPPGSTFKIVTACGAIADGVTGPDTSWSGRSPIKLGGGRVSNYGGSSYGSIPFSDAFARSVNTVFAQVGVKMGAARFVAASRRFGLDDSPAFPLTVRPSTITDPKTMDTWELAWAAVGQPVRPRAHGGPLVTPLQMALVGAAVANDGVIMEPRLLLRMKDLQGLTVATPPPRRWLKAMDADTARVVRDLMVRTVEQGTGTRAAIDGVSVGGKTGTAELATKESHAWFVGLAPADDPRVVVAIIIEHGGTGGRVAAPKAKQVLEAALGREAEE